MRSLLEKLLVRDYSSVSCTENVDLTAEEMFVADMVVKMVDFTAAFMMVDVAPSALDAACWILAVFFQTPARELGINETQDILPILMPFAQRFQQWKKKGSDSERSFPYDGIMKDLQANAGASEVGRETLRK